MRKGNDAEGMGTAGKAVEGVSGVAYVVYYACDRCGREGAAWVNHSVSFSICVKIARDDGWKVGKRGWICPSCQRKQKKKVEAHETV